MVCQIPNKDSSIQTFLSLYDSKLHQKNMGQRYLLAAKYGKRIQ